MNSKIILSTLIVFLFSVSIVSAITVTDVSHDRFFPGETTSVDLELKNNLDEDVEDVSFNLLFDGVPFISIGGSEKSYDEFDDGKTRIFGINIKSAQNIQPGDYSIPYILIYTDKDGKDFEKKGSIGIVVSAKTELDFDVELEKNVVGEQGTLTFKIVNEGFGDVKFVSVRIVPEGFMVIGSESDYIGNIDSDDFETASFDVVFEDENASVLVLVTYKDFDNIDRVENIQRDLTVYSKEDGIRLGIIERNNTFIYVILVLTVIVLWFVYRALKKRMRKNGRK
jgi:hypothetical protein